MTNGENRRSSLRKIAMTSGAIITWPAWGWAWTNSISKDYDSAFTAFESQLLNALVDTYIPVGNEGIGGVSVGVDLFLQKLFDRCYPEEIQMLIKSSLGYLNDLALQRYHIAFSACELDQRVGLVGFLASTTTEYDRDFIELTKSECIRGFRSSRKVLMKYYDYRIAPGKYLGCVDAESA